MLNVLHFTFGEALRTLRAKPLNTLLSTLGIVIGVGALFSILALADGMEKFARQEIEKTTDLASILVSPKTGEEVDGIYMKKENPPVIALEKAEALAAKMAGRAKVEVHASSKNYVQIEGDTLRKPAVVMASTAVFTEKDSVAHGQLCSPEMFARRDSVVVLNHFLAEKLAPGGSPEKLLGKTLLVGQQRFRVLGIGRKKEKEAFPKIWLPLYALTTAQLRETPPTMVVTGQKVETVPALKSETEQWLDAEIPGGKANFEVITNDFRLDQLRKAMLVFKIVMGMIVGIAVVVGGIGIMNVLLMSVTERTREIGIRKAIGAKRQAIAAQFLAESVAISLAGCLLGLLLGFLFMSAAIPIIKALTEVDFYAAYEPGTILSILLVATLIGLFFGTFPAIKASKLSPVEAIRHE